MQNKKLHLENMFIPNWNTYFYSCVVCVRLGLCSEICFVTYSTLQLICFEPKRIYSFVFCSRRVLMVKQNYRCAGCGMKVAQAYANTFRYCEYLGRYFCTGCHTNQLAVIPGKVLTKWDFTRWVLAAVIYKIVCVCYV